MNETTSPAPRPTNDAARTIRFVLWAGVMLAGILAVCRVVALGEALATGTIGHRVALLVQGLWQDWLIVLGLVLVTLAVLRSLTDVGTRRLAVATFVVLATTVLLIGVANLVALRLLGSPATTAWLGYGDTAPMEAALAHARTRVTLSQIAWSLGAVLLLWLGAFGLAGVTRTAGIASVMIGAMSLVIIAGAASRNTVLGTTRVWLDSPIVAFLASVGTRQATDTQTGEAGEAGAMPAGQLDLSATAPLVRPDQPAKPLRNVILFTFGATPAKQAQGWGGTHAVTPNLASRLDQALAFDQAYAHVPTSDAFLVSLLAGVIPEMSADWATYRPTGLDVVSLADVLAMNGLRTGFFNASDTRLQSTADLLSSMGFPAVYDNRDWSCETGTPDTQTQARDLCGADQITDWIAQDPDAPFFVAFHTGMTRHPYDPGAAPQTYVADTDHNNYLNALRVGDQAFGHLMAYLDQSGLADETLVIALGDHGEAFGEHGTRGPAAGLYEENVHIPLALMNPQLFSGDRSDLIVGVSDMAATITDLMGFATPSSWQGTSVFAQGRRDSVLFFAPWNGDQIGVRIGDHKYIYHGASDQALLFDLANDPAERQSLVASDPKAAEAARDAMGRALAAHNSFADWLRQTRSVARIASTTPTVVEIIASGTRFEAAPQAWVTLDGESIGGFEVVTAPSNATRAVTATEIAQAMASYRLAVSAPPCASTLEIFFLNDAWAGEGLSGDTDLVIRSVQVGATSYVANQFQLLQEGGGGPFWDDFRLSRKGGLRIALEPGPDCPPADPIAQE